MSRPGALDGRSLGAANDALARAWVRDFERSDRFATLAAPAQQALPGAARVLAACFTRRWDRATETPYPLNEMTSEDAVDVLTKQLPRRLAGVDADAILDGLVELLVWATKANKIQRREVEYACRTSRHDAAAAMRDERTWSPGKSIVSRALQDGVDAADLERLRAHAIATGLDPSFVDEFLPPGPTYLGEGRWAWTDAHAESRI